MLSTRELVAGYDERTVLDRLDLDLPADAFTVIVGPNACGKSTLLRTMARLLTPRAGTVLLDGTAIRELPTREVARRLGVLPQSPLVPEGVTVADLVGRGRQPHQRWWRQWSAAGRRGGPRRRWRWPTSTTLADRPVDTLSGGQRQRVWIAMTLAQQTDALLLDEPTTFLDLAHQVEILDLLHRLRTERGRTVVAVLHDLNQAARYADHLVAMRDGAIVAAGPPRQILTADLVRDVFGLDCVVVPCPVSGAPLVVPPHHPIPGGYGDRRTRLNRKEHHAPSRRHPRRGRRPRCRPDRMRQERPGGRRERGADAPGRARDGHHRGPGPPSAGGGARHRQDRQCAVARHRAGRRRPRRRDRAGARPTSATRSPRSRRSGCCNEPDLEAITALKPDLILGSKFRQEKFYDELSAIAPTVFTEKVGITWKENFLLDGQALGKEQQAKDLLAGVREAGQGGRHQDR